MNSTGSGSTQSIPNTTQPIRQHQSCVVSLQSRDWHREKKNGEKRGWGGGKKVKNSGQKVKNCGEKKSIHIALSLS
jgi:hypothetical protein